jgi:pectate lyase
MNALAISPTRLKLLFVAIAILAVPMFLVGTSVHAGAANYNIWNQYSAKCIDSPSGNNGQLLQQWDCNYGNNQYFVGHLNSDGSYYLENQYNGKCIDVPGWSRSNGVQLQLYSCTGGSNQHWWASWQGNTYEIFQNVNSGLCIDLRGWNRANGAAIQQYSCTHNSNQIWATNSI